MTAWHKPIKFVYYFIVAVQYKVRHRSESVHPSVVSGCPSKGVGFLQFRNINRAIKRRRLSIEVDNQAGKNY